MRAPRRHRHRDTSPLPCQGRHEGGVPYRRVARVSFPEFQGERFCPEQLVWFRIARRYKLRYVNKPIYIAEYQPDGITAGITRARMKSPSASMLTYAELTECPVPLKTRVKAAINFWRFWYCRTATSVVPRLAPIWHCLRPLGWAMHRRDRDAS